MRTREVTIEERNEEYQKPIVIAKEFSTTEVKREENRVTPRSPKKAVQPAIAHKTAMFESSPTKLNNDPALMSLAERKALFEKNKGSALVPKAAFAMPIPISNKENKGNINTNQITPKPTRWNIKPNVNKEINEKSNNLQTDKVEHTKNNKEIGESSGIASKIAALINNKNTISQEQISNNIKEQRQKDMEVLINRFNRNKEVSTYKSGIFTNNDKVFLIQVSHDTSNVNKNCNLENNVVNEEIKSPVRVAKDIETKQPCTPDRRSGEKRPRKTYLT